MLSTNEIIVDNFAGGGGASTALSQALGRDPHEAINHDPIAIAMHRANHPRTRHWCQNIWQVDPRMVAERRPIGVAWFSPDCTHHSKAKGGKPLENRRRDLAWVVQAWARTVAPRIIFLENVEEFADWGPLVDGRPCPDRKGLTFKRWVRELRRLGYDVDWTELRACDYGAPTTRKRLFMVARCDGAPIRWPDVTHARAGGGGLVPWRTAAEVIDWNLSCPSIFLSRTQAKEIGVKRPLAPKTMARIAAGVGRYVINAAEPFIVPVTHTTGGNTAHAITSPLRTITTAKGGEFALVAPSLIQSGYGERRGQAPRILDIGKPLGTVVAGGSKHALVSAFLAQHNTGMVGHAMQEPVSTLTERGSHQQVVTAHLLNLKGTERRDRDVREPVNAITSGGNHVAEVRAFLIKYHETGGRWQAARDPLHTVDAKARYGLVKVWGETWRIADIGMRMLTARELFKAQGFPDSYIIDPYFNGRSLTKSAQISCCGNSVSPPPAVALVRANVLEAPRARRKPLRAAPLLEAAA